MKIAIIGSGISGLGAAYLLHQQHDVTIYEKNDYTGGHSRTVHVDVPEGRLAVDTGFIVFNYRNYPLLTGLFNHLDVPVAKSDMSFGVSINDAWLEYGTQHASTMLAQKRNMLRPAFWRMVADILRFNRQSYRFLDEDPSITLGKCLEALGMGRWFREYYLLAMGGAIWSTPTMRMLDFPARTFIRFFDNHGLLSVNGQPQWYTVRGGSTEYVKRLSAPFAEQILHGCGAAHVIRYGEKVEVMDTLGNSRLYDQVIFACHSDQALNLLHQPTSREERIIGAIKYQPNTMVLHSDTRFMPKRKKAWASWVYLCDTRSDETPSISLSYWMNRLQPLETKTPLIVTLNPGREPDPDKVYNTYTFEHPVFDAGAIEAQHALREIQGKDRIWYCGAWQRYGFHEDGLRSGVEVATALGASVPWE